MLFQPFKKSHAADTPNFVYGAAIDQRQKEYEDDRKDQMIGGGIDQYNQFMGDDTPIRDWGRGVLGLDNNVASTSGELATAMKSLEAPVSHGVGIMGGAIPGSTAATALAPATEALGILGAGGSAIPAVASVAPAVTAATGAAGAGAAGAGMAAAGPAGIALALASMLGLFG